MARSKVGLFEQIRRDRRAEGLSIRELAEKHRVHRRTVRQVLASAVPPPRNAYPRRPRPAIGPSGAVGFRRQQAPGWPLGGAGLGVPGGEPVL